MKTVMLTGTQTIRQDVPVEIPLRDAAYSVCAAILDYHGIPREAYLDSGRIVTWDPGRGGSGLTTVEIAAPTAAQIAALNTCRSLMDRVREVVNGGDRCRAEGASTPGA